MEQEARRSRGVRKVVRLQDPYAAAADNFVLQDSPKEDENYKPLNVVGEIKEKGFSSGSSKVSLPEMTALPFPVARHRSEGPYWAPLATDNGEDFQQTEEDYNDMNAESLAPSAQPLHRKKRPGLQLQNWREVLAKQSGGIEQPARRTENPDFQKAAEEDAVPPPSSMDTAKAEENILLAIPSTSRMDSTKSEEDIVPAIPSIHERSSSKMQSSNQAEAVKAVTEEQAIDAENRARIFSMTFDEVIDARKELAEKLSPELLKMLKRRGAERERRQIGVGGKTPIQNKMSSHLEPMEVSAPLQGDTTEQEDGTVKPDKLNEFIRSDLVPFGKSWTERIEGVKTMRFDLDGKLISTTGDKAPVADGDNPVTLQSVPERDYLRSEGDPVGSGYTIKEAAALSRSTVPAQRAVALQLIAAVLHNAANGLALSADTGETDWQAIWAYALGPHPELVLTLRLALDDTHVTAVTSCAKALQALLTCFENDIYFNLREALWSGESLFYTAPVFRKHIKQEGGFLGGGHWKYNVKPLDLFPKANTEDEGQDDAAVANKDVVAGLLRMGILPRIRYILEVEQLAPAEEPLLSVLIGVVRHSPTAADAIMKCPRLIDTIVQNFLLKDESPNVQFQPARTKAIQLLKVLSQACKSYCIRFAELGALQVANSDLFKWSYRFAAYSKVGQDFFKGLYCTLIEALRLWRVCIHHEIGISLFPDFYPALCTWLSPPSVDQILNDKMDDEAFGLAQEAYNVLEVLARTLPILKEQPRFLEVDTLHQNWSWSIVLPVLQNSIDWLQPSSISIIIRELRKNTERSRNAEKLLPVCGRSFMGALGSVLHFLSTVCERVCAKELMQANSKEHAWLPEFVPQVGLSLVRSKLFSFSEVVSNRTEAAETLVSCFLEFKDQADSEILLTLTNCLHAAIRLAYGIDKLISWARISSTVQVEECGSSEEERILNSGIVASAKRELKNLSLFVGKEAALKSHIVQDSEFNGRGGPAPGVGFGWGSVGGGFWSSRVFLVQVYAKIALDLEGILSVPSLQADAGIEDDKARTLQLIESFNAGLGVAAITVEPSLVRRALADIIFTERHWLLLLANASRALKHWREEKNLGSAASTPMESTYPTSELEASRNSLIEHYTQIWLQRKTKKARDKPSESLPTIHEDSDGPEAEIEVIKEWTGLRLPLPCHWLLSPLHCMKEEDNAESTGHLSMTVLAGLALLLGLEGISGEMPTKVSMSIPIARKVHALSTVFILGDVFLERVINDILGVLQDIYGFELDQCIAGGALVRRLDFQGVVDSNYSLFVENLAQHFVSASYGDLNFGRQIAFYLRREVAFSIRQTVWKVLAEAKVLYLLPTLEKCSVHSSAYLHPPEEEAEALEMYVSTWTSGGLDKAFLRKALPFRLAVHHVAEFLFGKSNNLLLRKKFARNIIRTSKRNQQAKEMLMELVHYFPDELNRCKAFMIEACEKDSALLSNLQRLFDNSMHFLNPSR